MVQTALAQRLAAFAGGTVLDIATSEGGFVQTLAESLSSYDSIVGIDTNADRIATARERVKHRHVSFAVMDATALTFPDAAFDTVTAAYSLHHLPDIGRALAEMYRVLRPGGLLLVLETFQDGQNETQLTSVYVHHWIAEVDMATGVHHQMTLTRRQILECIQPLHLQGLESFDIPSNDADPHDPEQIQELLTTCDRYIERVERVPRLAPLVKKGRLLKQRIADVGALEPTALCVIGRK